MKGVITILSLVCAGHFTSAQVKIINTIAGNDTMGYCCDNGPATNAKFNHPTQLWLDKLGSLYICDGLNNRVRKLVLSTGIVTTIAGTGAVGYSGDGHLATDALLSGPFGICMDTLGNIYFSELFNNIIRKINVGTNIITTICGNGTPGYSGDGFLATNALINAPQGLTIDMQGNLYFAEYNNHVIRKISPSGIITTAAGNGTAGSLGDFGPATNAQLNNPSDVGIDKLGNIVFGDELNHTVRKVTVSTGIITRIAGIGGLGYSGDGGFATSAAMSHPGGVFIDKANDIYIAEAGNAVIRKIDGANGVISTVAGCGVIGFSGDGGPATDAKLQPDDIWVTDDGIMYIADFSNNRIRIVYNDKLGVINTPTEPEIALYPNPVKDELIIEHAVNQQVRIYNVTGQQVLSFKLKLDKEVLSTGRLSGGIYITEFRKEDGEVEMRRFVKE